MKTPPPDHPDRMTVPIVALALSVALMLLLLSTLFIIRNRDTYFAESRLKSKTQAQLLGENTSSLIYAADASLLSARAAIRSGPAFDPKSLRPLMASLQKEIRLLPQVRDTMLLDAGGRVIFRADPQSDFIPESFKSHRDAWLDFSAETRLLKNGRASIVLSRRVEDRNGNFSGVLAAEIDAGFFYDRYNDYLSIDADAVMLFDSNGRILASWSGHADFSKAAPGDSVFDFLAIPHDAENRIDAGGIRTVEGPDFFISVYQTRGFPFNVAVIHEKKALLLKWSRETRRDIAVILLTYLTALLTLVLVLRQRKERKKAEDRLHQYRLELEETVARRTRELDRSNKDLTRKNTDLERAISEIRMLKGIIPICAHCKKVRDDKGYWQQVEQYIRSRSEAEFSHGICPDCAKKFYPGIKVYDD